MHLKRFVSVNSSAIKKACRWREILGPVNLFDIVSTNKKRLSTDKLTTWVVSWGHGPNQIDSVWSSQETVTLNKHLQCYTHYTFTCIYHLCPAAPMIALQTVAFINSTRRLPVWIPASFQQNLFFFILPVSTFHHRKSNRYCVKLDLYY